MMQSGLIGSASKYLSLFKPKTDSVQNSFTVRQNSCQKRPKKTGPAKEHL
jgi:hypothetical protein